MNKLFTKNNPFYRIIATILIVLHLLTFGPIKDSIAEVYVDSVYKGLLSIPYSAAEYKDASIALGKLKGSHTIRIAWVNDYWVPDQYDANIQIGNIQFILDEVIYSAVSTTYIGSLYEKDSTGAQTKHIFLGANRIASVSSESISYYHSDHIGSSNVITDEDGGQVQLLEYTPYGTVSRNEGTRDTDYRFTGKILDESAGLYFYGARYYDPELGRFITADTIVQSPSDPQSLNRYSYCRNNPVNYTDPTGHSWKSFWHKVESAWDKYIKPVVISAAIAAAVVFTWGAVAPGITGAAALFSHAGATIVASSAATTATLGTGEGRQFIDRLSNEVFDDVFGMRPSTARIWGNAAAYMAVNMGYQFGFARLFGANKAITDIRDAKTNPEATREITNEGKGVNWGTRPEYDPVIGEVKRASKLFYSGNEPVGVGAEALKIGGQYQHLGLILKGSTLQSDMASFFPPDTFRALSQGYLSFGISHTAVNMTLLNAGYGTTINSLLPGGWSTIPSTFVYGPYGGGLTGAVANEQIKD